MRVIAEFEKPENCADCPCVYLTEGAFSDRCLLTNTILENPYKIGIDESCPLKAKEDYVKQQSNNAH